MAARHPCCAPLQARVAARGAVEAAIDRLPDALRTVLVLGAIEDMRTEAIAAALDLHPNVVRERRQEAARRVRETLAREIDTALGSTFTLAAARCDRIVAGVLARLSEAQARGA
jgi:RNA polymerase sigma-70 factor (ECF subfamily)